MDVAQNLCYYFKKLMTLSNECRCVHEHGDVSITRRGELEAQQNHLPPIHSDSIQQNRVLYSFANEYKLNLPDISEKWMDSGPSHSSSTNPSLCEDTKERNQGEKPRTPISRKTAPLFFEKEKVFTSHRGKVGLFTGKKQKKK